MVMFCLLAGLLRLMQDRSALHLFLKYLESCNASHSKSRHTVQNGSSVFLFSIANQQSKSEPQKKPPDDAGGSV